MLTREDIRSAPKVLLHDHLDGGVRPQTVLEISQEIGHPLPAEDAESLGTWFQQACDSGSLVRYLETFDPHGRGDADLRPHSPGGPGVR
ncbi:MAG: hypothetical protein V9F00_10880 [Nocardioides sp.]